MSARILSPEEIKLGHDRYEKLRKLTPLEFTKLYQRNIQEGFFFDDLVDAWPETPSLNRSKGNKI